jgi:[ribosomal protein S5]-alanine N-acetyltransferase
MKKPLLSTARLNLYLFDEGDIAFIRVLLNTPGWLQFIGNRNIHSDEDALNYIRILQSSYEKNGFGFYKVEAKDSGKPAGMCGLIKRDGLDHPDIGFAFLPEEMGKGYAVEAALAVKNYAFLQLNIHILLAITNTDNLQSMKLLKKIGMQYERNIILNNEELSLFSTLPDVQKVILADG